MTEDYRQKGIGKKLLEKAEVYFREQGLEYVELQVSGFNNNAQGAYEHMGYTNRQTLMFKKI